MSDAVARVPNETITVNDPAKLIGEVDLMSSSTAHNGDDTWLLIETMGGKPHTLVFDTDRTRNFSSIIRRTSYRGDGVTTAINDLVDEITREKGFRRRMSRLPDDSVVHVLGAPVAGPDGVVFAVIVLLTSSSVVDEARFLPAPRRVGAFAWDPANQVTYHGPTIETEIMGVDHDPQAERISPEIFKLFDEFPGMAELGIFVSKLQGGAISETDTFASDLLMTGVDSRQRSCFMTFRAVPRGDGTWFMRGLVHDISDVKPPAPTIGFNAGLVRSAFGMADMPESGIGHLNFPTKVITEWFSDPPAPIDRWTTENAQIHSDDQPVFDKQITTLAVGDAETAEFEIRLKFVGTGWILTRFDVRAALPGDMGQGLVKVTPISPKPGQAPPLDPDSGILAW